jgi:hypothetical protein
MVQVPVSTAKQVEVKKGKVEFSKATWGNEVFYSF